MKAARPDVNIEILGVNQFDVVGFNEYFTYGTSLAWLQDTAERRVWGLWDVAYRDVQILDSSNQLHAIFNLTSHDLGFETNRLTLKQLFLSAANALDTDRDRLPDDWEIRYFGNLSAKPNEDTDGDGYDNFTEFVFGTNPALASSRPLFNTRLVSSSPQKILSLSFRRQMGSFLDYVVEASDDLTNWTTNSAEIVITKGPQNLFDGTGAGEVTYSLKSTNSLSRFFRIRASPRLP